MTGLFKLICHTKIVFSKPVSPYRFCHYTLKAYNLKDSRSNENQNYRDKKRLVGK